MAVQKGTLDNVATPSNRRIRVKYRRSLVTYIDILGFEELLKEKSPGEISRILRILKESVEPQRYRTKIPRSPDEHFVNFSDLTVTSIPIREPGQSPKGFVFYQLLHLVHAQTRLIADDGIFVRGAVTVGDVAKSWGLLYGPGIVDAYRLESKKAIHPRIVVDQKVLDELETNAGLWAQDKEYDTLAVRKMLRKDAADGLLYLDYLRASQTEVEPEVYEEFLEVHELRIKQMLKRHARKKRVRKKYEWLDCYHRQTVSLLGT